MTWYLIKTIICSKIKNIVIGAENIQKKNILEIIQKFEKIIIINNILQNECSDLLKNFFENKRKKKK